MRKLLGYFLIALVIVIPVLAQTKTLTRDETRELVRASLNRYGTLTDVNTSFRQSDKMPYNFVGTMKTDLKNTDYLEIVISVSNSSSINFRVYPHYNGGYLNLDKVKDPVGFARKLLGYNDTNFIFWGADDGKDVFAGYTFTLESGYPDEAIRIVLRSIHNTDKYVGEMRPMIDGTTAAQ